MERGLIIAYSRNCVLFVLYAYFQYIYYSNLLKNEVRVGQVQISLYVCQALVHRWIDDLVRKLNLTVKAPWACADFRAPVLRKLYKLCCWASENASWLAVSDVNIFWVSDPKQACSKWNQNVWSACFQDSGLESIEATGSAEDQATSILSYGSHLISDSSSCLCFHCSWLFLRVELTMCPYYVPFRYWNEFHVCAVTVLADCHEGASDMWEKLKKDSKKLNIEGSLFQMCGGSNGSASPRPFHTAILPLLMVSLSSLLTWIF